MTALWKCVIQVRKNKEIIRGGEWGPDDPSFVDFLISLKILCVLLCLSQGLPKNGRMAARKRSREASSGTSWQEWLTRSQKLQEKGIACGPKVI